MSKAKKVIPCSHCICDASFTYMGIICNMNEDNKEVSKHVDNKDNITVLFHIGFPTKGGEINYYSNYGKLQQQI